MYNACTVHMYAFSTIGGVFLLNHTHASFKLVHKEAACSEFGKDAASQIRKEIEKTCKLSSCLFANPGNILLITLPIPLRHYFALGGGRSLVAL